MSLTVPTYWDKAAKGSSSEIYLIQMAYGTGSDYIGLSVKDIYLGGAQYYGVVQDITDIREKIDITQSKGSISNVTIVCVNKWKTGRLTDIMFTGTASTEFINRDVSIYSRMGDANTLSDCVQIFQGRLKKIEYNNSSVSFEIEQHIQWRDLKIPSSKSNFTGKYAPVAYGDFSPNSEDDYQTNKNFYPAPFEGEYNGKRYYITADSSSWNNCYAHYYDENLGQFIRIKNLTSTSFSLSAVMVAGFTNKFERGFKIRPNDVSENDSADWSDPENSIDGSGATYATYSATMDGPNDVSEGDMYLSFKRPSEGDITGSVELTGYMQLSNPVDWGVSGDNTTIRVIHYDGGSEEELDSMTYQSDWGSDPTQIALSNATDGLSGGVDKDRVDIIVRAEFTNSSDPDAGDMIDSEVGISDVELTLTVELNALNDETAREILDGLDEIYMSGGNFGESYTGGSSSTVIDDIHEAHRDILARFGGFDYSDGNMVGWSALDTARTDWALHYWVEDPTEIEKVLEKLQFEGCFVFMPTTTGGKYIFVEDSYSSGDVVYTITQDDISDETVEHSDVNDMVTSTIYNYNKNAATDKYMDSTTETLSASRTAYWKSISSNENIKTVNLDALTTPIGSGTNPNDSIARYYENINGEPKVIVSGNIKNRAYFDLQYGDIVKFDFEYDPFSKSWSSLYFMVTETKRNMNELKIVAREVYSS